MARKDDKGILLELWAGSRLLKELLVPQAQHGPLYNDGWFGVGAEWSPDESRVVYVAEVSYHSFGGGQTSGILQGSGPKVWDRTILEVEMKS